jgi:urate oxidase
LLTQLAVICIRSNVCKARIWKESRYRSITKR